MTLRNASLTLFEYCFEPQGWALGLLPGEVGTTIAERGAVWIQAYLSTSNELLLVVAPSMDTFVDGEHEANIYDAGRPNDAPFFELDNGSSEALVWIFEPEGIRVGVAPGSILVIDCDPNDTRIDLTLMASGEWYVWVSQDHDVCVDGVVAHRGSRSVLQYDDMENERE